MAASISPRVFMRADEPTGLRRNTPARPAALRRAGEAIGCGALWCGVQRAPRRGPRRRVKPELQDQHVRLPGQCPLSLLGCAVRCAPQARQDDPLPGGQSLLPEKRPADPGELRGTGPAARKTGGVRLTAVSRRVGHVAEEHPCWPGRWPCGAKASERLIGAYATSGPLSSVCTEGCGLLGPHRPTPAGTLSHASGVTYLQRTLLDSNQQPSVP